MVKFNLEVTYQGYLQEKIRKGDKAGQPYYIVRFNKGFDNLECKLYDIEPELLQKLLKLEELKKYNVCFGISQSSGNTYLNLVDLLPLQVQK